MVTATAAQLLLDTPGAVLVALPPLQGQLPLPPQPPPPPTAKQSARDMLLAAMQQLVQNPSLAQNPPTAAALEAAGSSQDPTSPARVLLMLVRSQCLPPW